MNFLLRKISDSFIAIGILLILFISIGFALQFKKMNESRTWVSHTYQVVINAQQVLEEITYIESMQRGFLLFKDAEFISDVQSTQKELQNSINYLINLVSDNPTEHQRALQINTLINQRLGLIDKVVSAKLKNENQLILSPLITQTKNISKQLRDLINLLIRTEYQLLQIRNNNLQYEVDFNSKLLMLGGVTGTLLLILAFILLSQNRKVIRTKERQLRGIIDGAKDIIVMVDPEMRFILFNSAFKSEFFKLFHKEVKVGMSFREALEHVPQYTENIINLWQESLSSNEPFSKIISFNIENKLYTYEVNSSRLYDYNNNLIGAVQITRNISERVKEQKQLEETNIRLNETMDELQDKNKKITILLDMSDVMLAANSLTELSEINTKYAKEILNFTNGYTYIMHASKNLLEADSKWGEPVCSTQQFTPDDCWALRLGKIHYYINENDLVCRHAKENTFYMCVPLRAQNDIFGLLYIEWEKNFLQGEIKNNDKLIISAFAEVTALAIANVTLRENLRYQSIRDPLTTLYNRRYLEEFLYKEIAQSKRNKHPVSILMLDLDHFKRINDVYGHEAGDLILKEFSKILIKEIRPGDLASRYGGEEFLIILINTNVEIALMRAESIRAKVANLSLKYGTETLSDITVSIGVSCYPKDGQDVKKLIEKADKALYKAKNLGRNQVVISEENYN